VQNYLTKLFYVCILFLISGCGDETNYLSSAHNLLYDIGGMVYAGDGPLENVTISIIDAESTVQTTSTNLQGLWRMVVMHRFLSQRKI